MKLFGKLFIFSYMGVSKNRGTNPQNGWFISWKPLLKWMIWGYHYFWKRLHKSLPSMILFRRNARWWGAPHGTLRDRWV